MVTVLYTVTIIGSLFYFTVNENYTRFETIEECKFVLDVQKKWANAKGLPVVEKEDSLTITRDDTLLYKWYSMYQCHKMPHNQESK